MFHCTMADMFDCQPFILPRSLLAGSMMTNGAVTTVVGKAQRVLLRGQKVRVYRNLNKPEFFSVMACEGEFKGLVCGYARAVRIVDGRFVVSEKSRQRVIREQCRNVHAFVEGILDDMADMVQVLSPEQTVAVTYNPYKMGAFYTVDTGNALVSSGVSQAVLQGANVYLLND